MDDMRGQFHDHGSLDDGHWPQGPVADDAEHDLPPSVVGQDERRMQVRAYNFWAGLLADRNFPAIEDFEPEEQIDFGPHSVLLDFTGGVEDPGIAYLGKTLAAECGTDGPINRLSDVPSRSLLSRITDHYLQIIANQAPIGFEAEFVNQRGKTILYRGILLPFSSDDDTIDFIYGVINWKELADQQTTDELLLEINQALDPQTSPRRDGLPLANWADGPTPIRSDAESVLDLPFPVEPPSDAADLPRPAFGASTLAGAPAGSELSADADAMELADWLASARALAEEARGHENRSRHALYAAISRAYDFSLAARADPVQFAQIVADAGLTLQARAPLTPVVKLVFGADYDKTRLTEYAAALGHAHRLELERGAFADYLAAASGGIKQIVAEERRLRRHESGQSVAPRTAPREALARKLRARPSCSLAEIPATGSEFALLLARRTADGEIVLLGQVADDPALIERAARKILD